MRLRGVQHVVHPAGTLLDAQIAPFGFGHQVGTRNAARQLLRDDNVPVGNANRLRIMLLGSLRRGLGLPVLEVFVKVLLGVLDLIGGWHIYGSLVGMFGFRFYQTDSNRKSNFKTFTRQILFSYEV